MLKRLIGASILSMATASAVADKVSLRIQETNISLVQAIQIAEKHVGGRAYEAELEKNSFGLEYEIDLIGNSSDGMETTKVEVTIDAKTGEVLNQRSKRVKRD